MLGQDRQSFKQDMRVTGFWPLLTFWVITWSGETYRFSDNFSAELLSNLKRNSNAILADVCPKAQFLDQVQTKGPSEPWCVSEDLDPLLVLKGNASEPTVPATSPFCNSSTVSCNLSVSVSACTCADQEPDRVDETNQLLNCPKCYISNCSRHRVRCAERLLRNQVSPTAYSRPRLLVQPEVRRRRKVHQKHLERLANHSRISLSYYCLSACYFASHSVRTQILQEIFRRTHPQQLFLRTLVFLPFQKHIFRVHATVIPRWWQWKTLPIVSSKTRLF